MLSAKLNFCCDTRNSFLTLWCSETKYKLNEKGHWWFSRSEMKIEYELAIVVYLPIVILWLKYAIYWMTPWRGEEKRGKRRGGQGRGGKRREGKKRIFSIKGVRVSVSLFPNKTCPLSSSVGTFQTFRQFYEHQLLPIYIGKSCAAHKQRSELTGMTSTFSTLVKQQWQIENVVLPY